MSTGGRGHGTHKVGDPLPSVLLLSDLVPLLGLSVTRLWHLEQRGDFAHWEMTPRIGDRARYSGKKIQAWLDAADEPEAPSATNRPAQEFHLPRRPHHDRRDKGASHHGYPHRTKRKAAAHP